jgi:hypothetical protein
MSEKSTLDNFKSHKRVRKTGKPQFSDEYIDADPRWDLLCDDCGVVSRVGGRNLLARVHCEGRLY